MTFLRYIILLLCELTSPCPILVMPSTRRSNDKYTQILEAIELTRLVLNLPTVRMGSLHLYRFGQRIRSQLSDADRSAGWMVCLSFISWLHLWSYNDGYLLVKGALMIL